MRAVVQRVSSASVTVDGNVVSSISKGLMVLVGLGRDDTTEDVDTICKKILKLRIFDDGSGAMWKKNVKDIDGDVLCVSQFTLFANTHRSSNPDFHRAMGTEAGRQMYASFLDKMQALYKPDKIKSGRFGAMMNVSLTNEGPVTFTLDSRKFEYVNERGGDAGAASKATQQRAAESGRTPATDSAT
ncbi:D-Tyr tRNAtyr deacylase-like domain-containing protein [Rhodofomes roseus]|uniref:D-aminoacyl-tRNA deacylase n=1 Tax=Rhodofomes roseus TaxID=34475 RepID=A0ABQ8KVY4_9APHY|nr:D-Tyr tRNAtyr deacylase-like domain-containing protein [Rhodofomes roseus]KAH9843139.1 D-Tyr tRNAtyr deacylase-like domain-containing protein [Rhodofomes roseus]